MQCFKCPAIQHAYMQHKPCYLRALHKLYIVGTALTFWRARYAACVTALFETSGPGSLQLRLPLLPDIAASFATASHLRVQHRTGELLQQCISLLRVDNNGGHTYVSIRDGCVIARGRCQKRGRAATIAVGIDD